MEELKGFIEVTEYSQGSTRKIFVKVEYICRLCECGTVYTIDGERFIVNEPIEEIKELIKNAQ